VSLIVQKYGGTSVGSPERIRAVAARIAGAREAGHDLVVVVSAMGSATDELVTLARGVTGRERVARHHPREFDMLLTAGERISMALLAMALRETGHEAVSFTGSQAAIITDEVHTAARITEVRADRVREEISRGRVVIVAGFQGVSRMREITTLGRGGSDTSAVALAAALDADRCEIYTDVAGVYTADPRLVGNARVVRSLSYGEMVELAGSGASVMHPRAIEIGAKFGVEIRVLSSFDDAPDGTGTTIRQASEEMEELILTGLASMPDQAKLTLRGLAAGMGPRTDILLRLADRGVSVDMITEAFAADGTVQLDLTVGEEELDEAVEIAEGIVAEVGGQGVDVTRGLSRIALVGSGMHGRPGVYARTFQALREAGVEVHAVSSSAISVGLLVPNADRQDALRALHDAFELEKGAEAAATAAGRS